MAAGLNKVTLIGNLGKDPEVRFSQSGVAVCNFSLAVTERRKTGDSWGDHTEWMNIVVFGKSGENAGKYLKKGSQTCIEGKLQTRKWQDREGKDRWTTEILANQVLFLGSRGETRSDVAGSYGSNQSSTPSTKASSNYSSPPADAMMEEDDIPF